MFNTLGIHRILVVALAALFCLAVVACGQGAALEVSRGEPASAAPAPGESFDSVSRGQQVPRGPAGPQGDAGAAVPAAQQAYPTAVPQAASAPASQAEPASVVEREVVVEVMKAVPLESAGPQGPAGPAGPAGAAGAAGLAGPAGPCGAADLPSRPNRPTGRRRSCRTVRRSVTHRSALRRRWRRRRRLFPARSYCLQRLPADAVGRHRPRLRIDLQLGHRPHFLSVSAQLGQGGLPGGTGLGAGGRVD